MNQLTHILTKTEFPAHALRIELTESALMTSLESVWAILNTLRSQGIRITIDQFGTGYSSLTQLHHLPIDSLKLDTALIESLHENIHSSTIIRAMNTMAQQLQLQTIAAGIETLEQIHQLRVLGCDYGQGHKISSPLTLDELDRFLTQRHQILVAEICPHPAG